MIAFLLFGAGFAAIFIAFIGLVALARHIMVAFGRAVEDVRWDNLIDLDAFREKLMSDKPRKSPEV